MPVERSELGLTWPRHLFREVAYLLRKANATSPPTGPLCESDVVTKFTQCLQDLVGLGYFDEAFGSLLSSGASKGPQDNVNAWLSEQTEHQNALWPLGGDNKPLPATPFKSRDEMLDVIEALHDKVSRPMERTVILLGHRRYSDFSRRIGQAIYRWRVNDILKQSDLGLILAEEGNDVGLLVYFGGGALGDLIGSVTRTPEPSADERVRNAVALFRARDANRAQKRSALAALVAVLEKQRGLLKDTLPTKDEAALFTIANKFDIRHNDSDQHSDYDDAFLDWIFWWYLATIELINQQVATGRK